MHTSVAPEYGLWLETVFVLAVGGAAVVGLAGLAERLTGSASWQRTLWRVATLGLTLLLLVELSGLAAAVVRVARSGLDRAETGSAAVTSASRPRPTGPAASRPTPSASTRGSLTVRGAGIHHAFMESPERSEIRAADGDGFLMPDGQFTAGQWASREPGGPERPAKIEGFSLAAVDFREDESAGADWALPGVADDKAPQPSAASVTEQVAAPEPAAGAASGSQRAWWPGVLWLLGAVALAGRFVWARGLLLLFRRRHARVGDTDLRQRVDRLARRLAMRRPVRVLEAAGLCTPVAFGTLRPTLALPAGFAARFDRREQEAMLAHELAHVGARDPAWQLAADLVSAVLWWHPLAWWARRRLWAASEAAADEASLAVPDGPDVLAACLVALGRQLAAGPTRRLGWLSVRGDGFRSGLGRRIERLLSLPKRPWQPPGRKATAVAMVALPLILVLVAILSTAWAHPRAASQEGGTTMNVLASSWRQSLAGVALLAFLAPISGDAASADVGLGDPAVSATGGNLPGERLLAMLGQDEEREGEAEEREGEERETREADEREKDEAGERERDEDAARERREGREREQEADRERAEGRAERRDRDEGESRQRREGREPGRAERRQRREAEEPERVPPEKLLQLRRELEARMAALKREREGLRDDQDAEAREIEAAMQQTEAQIRRINAMLESGRREPEGRRLSEAEQRKWAFQEQLIQRRRELAAQMDEKRRELEERAAQIKREIQKLGDDQDEEARQLQAKLNETIAQLDRLRRSGADVEAPGDRAAHLRELWGALARARQAGKEEEAARLKTQLEGLLGHALEPDYREFARRAEGLAEGERRRWHLKAAIENLRAAGLPDLAELVAREAEGIGREEGVPGRRIAPPPRPARPLPGMPGRIEPAQPAPPDEGLEQVVRDLRHQVQDLRANMEEMRAMLRKLAEEKEER